MRSQKLLGIHECELRKAIDQRFVPALKIKKISYDIPTKELDALYREFQHRLHPDRFTYASDMEQLHSQHWSTLSTYCYSELKDPLERARLVIKHLTNSDVNSENELITNDSILSRVLQDMSVLRLLKNFCVAQMQYNLQLEDVESKEQAQVLFQEIREDYITELSQMKEAFAQKNISQAQNTLNRCQMLQRILQQANYWTPDDHQASEHDAVSHN